MYRSVSYLRKPSERFKGRLKRVLKGVLKGGLKGELELKVKPLWWTLKSKVTFTSILSPP